MDGEPLNCIPYLQVLWVPIDLEINKQNIQKFCTPGLLLGARTSGVKMHERTRISIQG